MPFPVRTAVRLVRAVFKICFSFLRKKSRAFCIFFSTPFISTVCDATGLIVYFLIAKAVLGV